MAGTTGKTMAGTTGRTMAGTTGRTMAGTTVETNGLIFLISGGDNFLKSRLQSWSPWRAGFVRGYPAKAPQEVLAARRYLSNHCSDSGFGPVNAGLPQGSLSAF
jgi:hypothetical protein